MKNKKNQLIGALYILRKALKCRDAEDAHNILIDGSYDYDREDEEECDKMNELMEQELCNYIDVLDELIKEAWLMEGSPELISNTGEKLSK
jgi:hypothetical protein